MGFLHCAPPAPVLNKNYKLFSYFDNILFPAKQPLFINAINNYPKRSVILVVAH